MTAHTLFKAALDKLPLVAILRGLRPAEAETVGAALTDAGWPSIEVPLNSPDPLQSIATLATRFPQALVGAGTVTTTAQVREVHEAGGRLIVSPHFNAAVVREAVRLGLVCLPGVMTATEAFAALDAGATGLKLFPAEMIPPAAVKALTAVLPPGTLLLPVGGISPANLAAYRSAGAAGFGIGSALYKPGMTPDQLRQNAMTFVADCAGIMRA
ncbi:MAG: 2-dehydro-3-deoxy-6-phosphogalactonate aldolase [Ramlibacter sp.]|nr:2-dehydro-3-deoxy-6-phosphogalactonate aldolase [Ramlibacter sp.]